MTDRDNEETHNTNNPQTNEHGTHYFPPAHDDSIELDRASRGDHELHT